MSKVYPQSKFEEMEEGRQVRVMLDLIYKIEKEWGDEKSKTHDLELFKNYFNWANFFQSENSFLKRIAPFEFNISNEISLRQLLDIAVPFERYLNLSVKDENILEILSQDKVGSEKKTFPLVLVLDHLRSAFNVGSIFRTADCLGVEHIYLIGYTPTPEDAGVQKTAMGTDKYVSWSQHNQITGVLEDLKIKGYQLVGLETEKNAILLGEFKAPNSVALIVGNERFGLSETLVSQLDSCLQIPMMGIKNSLNVANAVSVSVFDLVRQWKT